MSVRDSVPGFLSDKGRAMAFYYAVPLALAWVLSFLVVTWAFMLFGMSPWSVAVLAGLLGAVFAVILQEVVYDVQ